jgi:hypothetical protein
MKAGLPSRVDQAVLAEERLLSTRLDSEPLPGTAGSDGASR